MSGKVAVVTGAASGIGRASVVALAREGAAVVLADINTDRADVVADSIRSGGGRALVVRTDVSDSASVRHMVAAAVADFDAVDAVVHCAVDGDFVNRCDARITELDDQVWARMLDPLARAATQRLHLLPIPDPEDIAPFALFLASDESRAVTGAVFPADAGYLAFKSTDVPMADILKGKSE